MGGDPTLGARGSDKKSTTDAAGDSSPNASTNGEAAGGRRQVPVLLAAARDIPHTRRHIHMRFPSKSTRPRWGHHAGITGALVVAAIGLGCGSFEPEGGTDNGTDNGSDPATGQRQQAAVVCATGPTTFGIDVSRFQGDIDWSQLPGAGVKFAYIQISRKIDDIDAKFEFNWAQAKSVGILRGAYQRFQPDQDVLGQADIFLSKLGPFQAGDLPPMLDVEDSGGLPAATIAERVRQWLVYVEAATGVRPVIYTGRFFWQDQLGSADFTDYPLWIAHYTTGCPNIPTPWTTWAFHQYSSTAVLPGITANTVDVNHFNGTIDDLLALAGTFECGDLVCSGGETADSCPADCPPCQLIGATGATVDDHGPCFDVGGDPQYMRSETEGEGGTLYWTNTTDLAQASNFGRWNLHFAEAGEYRLEAHTPAPWGMSKQAVYQVEHAGTSVAVELDQSAVDGWSALGQFAFSKGGSQSLRLDDNTGEANSTDTKIVFDSVRLTRIDVPVDPLEPDAGVDSGTGEDSEDGAGCGCGAAGSSHESSVALAVLALVIVTRRRPGWLSQG